MLQFQPQDLHVLHSVLMGELVLEFVILSYSMQQLSSLLMGLPSFGLVTTPSSESGLLRLVGNLR